MKKNKIPTNASKDPDDDILSPRDISIYAEYIRILDGEREFFEEERKDIFFPNLAHILSHYPVADTTPEWKYVMPGITETDKELWAEITSNENINVFGNVLRCLEKYIQDAARFREQLAAAEKAKPLLKKLVKIRKQLSELMPETEESRDYWDEIILDIKHFSERKRFLGSSFVKLNRKALIFAFTSRKADLQNADAIFSAKLLCFACECFFGSPHSHLVAEIVNNIFNTEYVSHGILDLYGKSVKYLHQ